MIIFGILLGLVILAAMVYLSLSKRSNFSTRIASLIALAVMVISVIICLCFVFFGGSEPVDESIVIIAGTPEETPKTNSNTIAFLFLIVFFIGLLATVAVLSLKEHRKTLSVRKKEIDDLFLDES